MSGRRRAQPKPKCNLDDFLLAVDCVNAYVEVFNSIVRDLEALGADNARIFTRETQDKMRLAALETKRLENAYHVRTGEYLTKGKMNA